MIIALRFKSQRTWHLSEVGDGFSSKREIDSLMRHGNFWPPAFNSCGIKVVPNYPVDRKIRIEYKDFHLLDKNGLCKRCAKRLKDYAKFKFLKARWEDTIPPAVIWIRGTYDMTKVNFNTNFYNNLRYLQKVQENNK